MSPGDQSRRGIILQHVHTYSLCTSHTGMVSGPAAVAVAVQKSVIHVSQLEIKTLSSEEEEDEAKEHKSQERNIGTTVVE